MSWCLVVGQDRVGPSSKILASRSNSDLGRTNGGGLARAVGVYGCLRDLREPEVPGRGLSEVFLEWNAQKKNPFCCSWTKMAPKGSFLPVL